MRNFFLIFTVFLLGLTGSVFANGNSEVIKGPVPADGVYFAQDDSFPGSGWKSVVTLVIKSGRVGSVDWNGANIAAGPDKKTASKTGKYPMVASGGAKAEWYAQAAAVETFFKANPRQVPAYKDNQGHTDAIAGVSIHVSDFYNLLEKAVKAGPAGYGMYKDGSYHAEETKFADNGWKYTADFTVIGGYVVAASWNGIYKDGGDTKKAVSAAGKYPMVANGGAKSEWHVQAGVVEGYFMATQGKAPSFDEGGHADAVSGASINVKTFYDLAAKALVKR